MSRPLPTGLVTELVKREVPGIFLVELDWPDATIYVWNGYHTITWNGHDWLGLGHLGQIGEAAESGDMTANGMTLVLSGIPAANVVEMLRNDTQGRPAKVYFGVINGAVVSVDPACIFDGIIDVPSFSSDGKTATISINLEKEFIDNRSSASRYTPEDQKAKYPTDLGLDFVPGLAAQTYTWGRKVIAPVQPGGSGSGDGSREFNDN